jgi:NTP pyrophosphatase (non-canonical NTP hydrolase)
MHQDERIARNIANEIDALHLPIPMTAQAAVVMRLTAAVTRALGASAASQALAEFHAALGETFGDGRSSTKLRRELHMEENRELCDELELLADLESRGHIPEAADLVPVAKELADVVYIAYGTAFTLGIDLDAVFAEVHRSNTTKLGPDGRFQLREDGKVLKGEHYQPPDIAAVVS